MMEDQKQRYNALFSTRIGARQVEAMRKIIEKDESDIRASYAVSTDWISSNDFIELILNDSIFILELSFKHWENIPLSQRPSTSVAIAVADNDLTVDNKYFTSMVIVDLIMLENQIPYFLLQKLFDSITLYLPGTPTLYDLILNLFSLDGITGGMDLNFKHFTDVYRCVYEKTIDANERGNRASAKNKHNADKLSRSGVKLQILRAGRSLAVSFGGGCLSMPIFPANGSSDIILRNVIAYEQCHDPDNAFTSEYIYLMYSLVTTDKDVELLTASGINNIIILN